MMEKKVKAESLLISQKIRNIRSYSRYKSKGSDFAEQFNRTKWDHSKKLSILEK